MAQKKPDISNEEQFALASSEDYCANMFKDGNNRAENDKKVHDAPAYNRAAHSGEYAFPEASTQETVPVSLTTSHSRDGTDASGLYDEDGGHLGGTEKEIDDLEATAAPVDRTPGMKN